MLIVIIGYLYVVGIVAIANMVNGKIAWGVLMLLFTGVLPVGMWLWMKSRRLRADRTAFAEMQQANASQELSNTAADEAPLPPES